MPEMGLEPMTMRYWLFGFLTLYTLSYTDSKLCPPQIIKVS